MFTHAIVFEFYVLRQQDALDIGLAPATQLLAGPQNVSLGYFYRGLHPRGFEEPPVLFVQNYGWAGRGLHQTISVRPSFFIEVSFLVAQAELSLLTTVSQDYDLVGRWSPDQCPLPLVRASGVGPVRPLPTQEGPRRSLRLGSPARS